jgi:Tfp pilus assembly protein PilE
MLNKKHKQGSTLIALLVVVAVIALAAGAAYAGFGFVPDASWAEGV